MSNAEDIAVRLLSGLRPMAQMPVQNGVGVYVLCLRDGSRLPGIVAGRQGLLYVGMTDDDLSARNHLTHRDSSGSSPRRSLGALLRGPLGLVPVPRGRGLSDRDRTHFRFAGEGEARLTGWMRDNLLASQIILPGEVGAMEGDLIRLLQPCLNLTKLGGWRNPQKAGVMAARKACAVLAGRSGKGGGEA